MMLWKTFERIIYLFVSTGYCCTSTNKYIRLGNNVELYFKAVTVNSDNRVFPVSNVIFSPYDSQMLVVTYTDGKFIIKSPCFNCTFTGDTATGNITIRLDNVQTSSGGTYKHAVNDKNTIRDCVSVFILGVPSKPKITANKEPSVRDNVTLTCSSTSTTTPNTHALNLVYNWRVDGSDNPSDSRYLYSTYKKTLTLFNVVKADSSKRFTCTAKEEAEKGHTSVSSDSFSMNVLYGPDSLTFSPSEIYYEKEEKTNLDPVTCKAECNPMCTFTWKKLVKGTLTDVSSSAVLNLEMLTSTDAGIYQCKAMRQGTSYVMKNLTLDVIYGPEQMTLVPASEFYRENENSFLQNITCSSDCYVCEYSWTGPNLFSSKGPVFSLGRLSRRMAGNYSCTARNTKASQHTQQRKGIKVEVRYGPDNVTFSTLSALNVVEGELVQNITCSSHCFPKCTYSWKNVSDNSSSSSDNVLSLGTVDRYKNGSYRCTAINQDLPYLHRADNILKVIVKYAPDVSITLSGNNVTEGASLTLFCNGSGVPSDYNYVSFSQEWNSTKINNNNREVDGTEMYSSIHFNQLQLQDSGTYTCSLNNGVESISGILNQVSRRTLQVKVLPKVLADNMRFTGVTRGKAEIKVPVYSYPDLQDVKVTRYDGTEVESNDKYNKSMHDSVVMTNFYDTPVSLNGSEIEISILNLEEDDFGNYSLNLTNSLGFTSVLLFVIAEGPPSPPLNFHYLMDHEHPTFVWERNFNGGLEQSFVIQTASVETEQWINHTNINENDQQYQINRTYYRAEIRLQPGIYKARIFANNSRGHSEPVDLEFTLKILKEETETTSLPIGAIAGGSVSAIVMVVVIGVVVLVVLRRMKGNKDGSKTQLNRSSSPDDNDEDEVQTVNPMYVSADEVKSGDNTYAMPVKKKKGPIGGDVYAMVDKKRDFGKKDFKKNKPSNHVTDADIYENASDTSSKRKAKKSTQEKRKAYEENPYENPNANEVNRKQKIVNKEGLIYADLVFNEQSKGQKKLVIHGIDDTTEYVEVDFNKKADPLPDSDEEENNTKK